MRTAPDNAAERASRARAKLTIYGLAFVLALSTAAMRWPGTLIGDSTIQLQEIRSGRITDWHPPLMALIWRAIGATPQAMLVLQNIIYWAGMALIADALRQRTSAMWGGLMLLAGLTPISLLYLGVVQKDTLLVAALTLTAGLCIRFGRPAAVIPGFLAALVRANAIFAVPPLFVRGRRLLPNLIGCAALSLMLLPIARFVNHSVIGAERSHVEKALQLFDIAGIARFSGSEFLGPGISRCYSVFYWDTLALDCQAFARTPDDLTTEWLDAIRREPAAYLQHRVSHFNHAIFFLVPPLQECVYAPRHHPNCGPGGDSLLKDAVLRNPLLWPVTWLVVGGFLMFLRLDWPAGALALSGLLYGFGYLVVGVASGFRYFYWTELAIQLALVWQVATLGLPRWKLLVALVVTVWTAGYLYRYVPLLV